MAIAFKISIMQRRETRRSDHLAALMGVSNERWREITYETAACSDERRHRFSDVCKCRIPIGLHKTWRNWNITRKKIRALCWQESSMANDRCAAYVWICLVQRPAGTLMPLHPRIPEILDVVIGASRQLRGTQFPHVIQICENI